MAQRLLLSRNMYVHKLAVLLLGGLKDDPFELSHANLDVQVRLLHATEIGLQPLVSDQSVSFVWPVLLSARRSQVVVGAR